MNVLSESDFFYSLKDVSLRSKNVNILKISEVKFQVAIKNNDMLKKYQIKIFWETQRGI